MRCSSSDRSERSGFPRPSAHRHLPNGRRRSRAGEGGGLPRTAPEAARERTRAARAPAARPAAARVDPPRPGELRPHDEPHPDREGIAHEQGDAQARERLHDAHDQVERSPAGRRARRGDVPRLEGAEGAAQHVLLQRRLRRAQRRLVRHDLRREGRHDHHRPVPHAVDRSRCDLARHQVRSRLRDPGQGDAHVHAPLGRERRDLRELHATSSSSTRRPRTWARRRSTARR